MTADTGSHQQATRSNRKQVLAASIVGILVVGFLSWNWWTSPTLLSDRTNADGQGLTVSLAKYSAWFGIVVPGPDSDAETITFKSAKPHFAENSANATAELYVCVRRSGSDPIGSVANDSIGRACEEVRPIDDGVELHWSDADPIHEYILLKIEPTTTGTVKIDRVTFDYSRSGGLHQRGEDEVDVDMTVRVTS